MQEMNKQKPNMWKAKQKNKTKQNMKNPKSEFLGASMCVHA